MNRSSKHQQPKGKKHLKEEDNSESLNTAKISSSKKSKDNSAEHQDADKEKDEKLKSHHPHHPNAKGYNIPYYSRNRNDHGSGLYGGQGYTSRGGYGRRG